MSDPKTTPAFGRLLQSGGQAMTVDGFSQYAEVAARFYAGILASRDQMYNPTPRSTAPLAFDHADAFFAELAKRTQL